MGEINIINKTQKLIYTFKQLKIMTQIYKLTTVTRRDLTPGYQATQAAHSLAQFIFEHPEISQIWFKDPYLAQLSVENEAELQKLITKLPLMLKEYNLFNKIDKNSYKEKEESYV